MTMYKVEFDRVGRNHNVEPIFAEAYDAWKRPAADHLAELIYNQVRRHLASRDVEVMVDLRARRAYILCGGFRSGGTGTITEVVK